MTGVSIEQWRGSIGRFNHLRTCQHAPIDRCKHFLIFTTVAQYLEFLKDHLIFTLTLIHSITILFAFSLMTIILLLLTAFAMPVLWTIQDLPFSSGNASLVLCMVFSFPQQISLPLKNLSRMLDPLVTNAAFFLLVLSLLLIIAGIETNPGPNSNKNLAFAVWNLDSLPARDFARIPLLESFQAEYKFDILGVCESALHSNIPTSSILIDGFSPDPFRADKSDNTRNGGVCLYYREDLPIKSRTDLATLPETIVAEIKLNRKKIFFVLSYRHPNISISDFKEYISSLQDILENINKENPSAIILSGDFNARSPFFWEGDSATKEGELFSEFLISQNMDELINEPTHIKDNGSQSCIDLICTNQPFLFADFGVLPSLKT